MDTNTQSLLHHFDWIPDAARALFDMVQKRSEAAPTQNAVNAALTAVTVTPLFSGGSSSSTAGTSTQTKTKTAKKTPVVVSTNLDD